MAISVNPPPILKLPKAFLEDREVREFIKQQNTILFQLWNRTGGVNDDVDEAKENITASSSRVSRNAARLNSLELKEFEIVKTTTSLTTEEFQIIICKNQSPIIITLDPQAIENDEVHIKRRAGEIKVIGSIDGLEFKIINIKNYNMHLVFDGTDWSEI